MIFNYNVMQRKELAKIFRDTVDITTKLTSHSFKQSEKWDFDMDVPPENALLDDFQPNPEPTKLFVTDNDTISEAVIMLNNGLEPLVLNMACDVQPGGGVKNGARAQEEDLFRCSNYELCVNKSLYPIGDDELIITNDVTIVKDAEYLMLDDFCTADFIAIPAVKRPLVSNDQYLINDDYEQMKKKIDSIFRYAIYQEHDTLLLGALGCGAYGNPSDKVASMFRETIEKYKYYFKEIRFAVLSHGKNNNYEVFKTILT
jgi:uncharacterized protein (TIGR02452 family)